MCGIFGYIGKKDSVKTCIEGLKQLEYRGYDSAGIAGIQNQTLHIIKEVGKISSLEKKVSLHDLNFALAIAHTRWATHGEPTVLNAHPHADENSSVAVIHNGIIENYESLRAMLMQKGVTFKSQTDTEVIAQLIAFNYKNDLYKAVQATIKMLKGSLAIAVIHQNHPDQIIAASRESPLAVGFDDLKEEILLSSDANAFLGRHLNVFYLRNDEIAVLSLKKIEVFDHLSKKIEKTTEKLSSDNITFSKNGFEHYMLKEIYEQPGVIQKVLADHMDEDFGTAQFAKHLSFSPQELMATKHILILACGTSWHAGSMAAALLEDMARIPTQAEIASEIRFKNPLISEDTLVIAISQSGETADTLGAVREAKAKGAKILGICNVKNSTLSREADSCLYLQAGPEISVCSTKAFTSQITLLSLFTLYMARLRHMSKEQGQEFLKEIKKIPSQIHQVLAKADQLQSLAEKYYRYNSFVFLGRRYMYATCMEAALKLKEISYLNANGYPAGELKHGPIALLQPDLPVIAFCANKQTHDKMLGNLMEVKARKSPILAFAPEGATSIAGIVDDVFWLPSTIDELAILPASVAGQIFAYYIAKMRNATIDQPRNLAKSVTVE